MSKYISKYFDSDIEEDTEAIIIRYIKQQVDKLQAITNLRHIIEDIYRVPDYMGKEIHNELVNKVVEIAEQMPQWELKGNFIKKKSHQKKRK